MLLTPQSRRANDESVKLAHAAKIQLRQGSAPELCCLSFALDVEGGLAILARGEAVLQQVWARRLIAAADEGIATRSPAVSAGFTWIAATAPAKTMSLPGYKLCGRK